jgi:hypothetical protein
MKDSAAMKNVRKPSDNDLDGMSRLHARAETLHKHAILPLCLRVVDTRSHFQLTSFHSLFRSNLQHALAKDLVSRQFMPTQGYLLPSTLPPKAKGVHLITSDVLRACEEGLKGVNIGIFTLSCLHTSAGLTVGT